MNSSPIPLLAVFTTLVYDLWLIVRDFLFLIVLVSVMIMLSRNKMPKKVIDSQNLLDSIGQFSGPPFVLVRLSRSANF